MVKIISTRKGDNVEASVELAGSLTGIVSELANAIGSAYTQIGEQDKKAARAFRRMFTRFVVDEDTPMWDGRCAEDVQLTASIVRKDGLTSADIADVIRRGASKDAIESLLEEM